MSQHLANTEAGNPTSPAVLSKNPKLEPRGRLRNRAEALTAAFGQNTTRAGQEAWSLHASCAEAAGGDDAAKRLNST